jgi:hypothetical protein
LIIEVLRRERRAAEEMLALVSRIARPQPNQPGGEQQRVAIARWSPSRRCCWPTSPPETWTAAQARLFWPCSSG